MLTRHWSAAGATLDATVSAGRIVTTAARGRMVGESHTRAGGSGRSGADRAVRSFSEIPPPSRDLTKKSGEGGI